MHLQYAEPADTGDVTHSSKIATADVKLRDDSLSPCIAIDVIGW